MSSNANFSIDKDGVVKSVNGTQMGNVVQSGGAGNYAKLKGNEERRKAKEDFERRNPVPSSSTASGKDAKRRWDNRKYKATSTAAEHAREESLLNIHNAASVEEHSLHRVSKQLDEETRQAEKYVTEVRKYSKKRK